MDGDLINTMSADDDFESLDNVVFEDLNVDPSHDLDFSFPRRGSGQSDDSNMFGTFLGNELGNDDPFPLDLDTTDANDILSSNTGPNSLDDPVWNLTPDQVRQEPSSLSTLLNPSQEIIGVPVSSKGKRGPGRPKGEKVPAQRQRPPFPARPTNRSRSRIKNTTAPVISLPPPPSLQLGARIKPESGRAISESFGQAENSSSIHSVRNTSFDTHFRTKTCHECMDSIDEAKLVNCDTCDKGFHVQCAKPTVIVLPKNGWKCSDCRCCTDCGSRTPGNGPSSRWHLNFSVCDSCYQQRNKGNYCPICKKAYRVLANSEMVLCNSCRKMVHPECDSKIKNMADKNLYVCASCDGPSPSGLLSKSSSVGSLDELADHTDSFMTRDSFGSMTEESLSSLDLLDDKLVEPKIETTENPSAGVFQAPPAPVGGKFPGKKRFSSGSRPRGPGGKFTGKKKAKTADMYRRKRTSKPITKFKTLSSPAGGNGMGTGSGTPTPSECDKSKDDEPQVETKMVLCSANDKFVLSQDVCAMCGSLGKGEEGRLIGCSQCGQCYHPYCVNIKVTEVVLTKGWRCLDCTVCEGCGQPHDEGRLLLCDECDISFHTYCLDPPLDDIPQGTWKCNWCVVCTKCSSTSPGPGSLWQKNYTECGPCASQTVCPVCANEYNESDLIIQCIKCDRWLHGKCDSMATEEDCEICSEFGYNCKLCRAKDELPPHLLIRKALAARKAKAGQESSSVCGTRRGSDTQVVETDPQFATAKNKVQYQLFDGVVLSDVGFQMIKTLVPEQPKRQRSRRSAKNAESVDEKEEDAIDDGKEDVVGENGEVKKKRVRNRGRPGVGGFIVKGPRYRGAAKDEVVEAGEAEVGLESTESEKRRRRRRTKKKPQLSDTFPSYLQEAFFGKTLLESSRESDCNRLKNDLSDEDVLSHSNLSSDKLVSIVPSDGKTESRSVDDSSGALDEDDLQDELKYLLPLGQDLPQDDELMNMLMDGDELDKTGSLSQLASGSRDGDSQEPLDTTSLLSENFDIDLGGEGLPHMDSQDVEDIFNDVLSPSANASSSQHFVQEPLNSLGNMNINPGNQVVGIQNKNLPLLHSPSQGPRPMMQHFPPSQTISPSQPLYGVVTSNLKQDLPSMPGQELYPTSHSWKDTEAEPTQGQKNRENWKDDEPLGLLATTSPVLYANTMHPDLKTQYPSWNDRYKQISKLWRQLSTDKRAPYLQKARENRQASRQTKQNKTELKAKTETVSVPSSDSIDTWRGDHISDASSEVSSDRMAPPMQANKNFESLKPMVNRVGFTHSRQVLPSGHMSPSPGPLLHSPSSGRPPSVDHFQSQPSPGIQSRGTPDSFASGGPRPQSHPPLSPHMPPFSPMSGHGENRFSPRLMRSESLPNQSALSSVRESSSPFTRPPSTSSIHPEFLPPPPPLGSSDPYSQMPMTPRPCQGGDDPYASAPMTPRPIDSSRVAPMGYRSHGMQSSDPYSQQPATPRPAPNNRMMSPRSVDPYSQPPMPPGLDGMSRHEAPEGPAQGMAPQQLRNLLQRKDPGQWMDHSRSPMPVHDARMPGFPSRGPVGDGFRQPLPPGARPRIMVPRPPDARFRQQYPQAMPQQHQQWIRQPQGPRMSVPTAYVNQQQVQQPHPYAMQFQSNRPGLQQPVTRPPQHFQHHFTSSSGHMTSGEPEHENLPDDLDDDELLGLGNDFNILEYADPELDKSDKGKTGNKNNILDEHFDEVAKEKAREAAVAANSKTPGKGQSQLATNVSGPPSAPLPATSLAPPPYPQPQQLEQLKQPSPNADQRSAETYVNAPVDSLLSDLDFERLKEDLDLDDPITGPGNPGPSFGQNIAPPVLHPYEQGQTPWSGHHPRYADGPQFHRFSPQSSAGNFGPQIVQHPGMRQGGAPHHPHMMGRAVSLSGYPPASRPVTSSQPPVHPALMPVRPRATVQKFEVSTIPEPAQPPKNPVTEADHRARVIWDTWVIDQKKLLEEQHNFLDSEVSRLRKLKKNLNAKSRQLKKSNTDLSDEDSIELSNISAELNSKQKGLEAVKRVSRQHEQIVNEFNTQSQSLIGSPQTAPRPQQVAAQPCPSRSPIVSAPGSSAMSGMLGPATPMTPGTPQSPAMMSPLPMAPSPSGVHLHSPAAGHNSPAHVHPSSPMMQSPSYHHQQRSPATPIGVSQDPEQCHFDGRSVRNSAQQPNYGHMTYEQGAHMQQSPFGSRQQGPYHSTRPENMRFTAPQGMMRPSFGDGYIGHGPPAGNYHQQVRRVAPPPYPGQYSQQQQQMQHGNPMQHTHHQHQQMSPQMNQYHQQQHLLPHNPQMNQRMSHPVMMQQQHFQPQHQMQHHQVHQPQYNQPSHVPQHENQTGLEHGHQHPQPYLSPRQHSDHQQGSSETYSLPETSDLVGEAKTHSLNFEGSGSGNDNEAANDNSIANETDQSEESNQVQVKQEPETPQPSTELESDELATQSEVARQNVLLKQLLQNCASADSSGANSAEGAASTNHAVDADLKDVPVVKTEETACSQNAVGEAVTEELLVPDGEVAQSDESNSASVSSLPERKLSYLDIRRAQLEREPTPPPPDQPKPKRKRSTAKKKEPKEKIAEGSGSIVASGAPARKRIRKGSQARQDEDYEKFLSTLMAQLRSLPPLKVVDPQIKHNFNLCSVYGAGDLNTKSSHIRGSFGNGFIPITDSDKNSRNSSGTGLRGFYNQEFANGTSSVTSSEYVCHLRSADSPISVISMTPEAVVYEESPLIFNCLQVIKELEEDELNNNRCDVRCNSPTIPIVCPRPIKIETGIKVEERSPDANKENSLTVNPKSTQSVLNSAVLRDAGNVAVTLTVSSSGDIKKVLGALAKLLEIDTPASFEVVERTPTPPSHKLGLFQDLKSDCLDKFCKFCDILILNDGISMKITELENVISIDKTEEDEVSFCDKNCYLQFAISQAPTGTKVDDIPKPFSKEADRIEEEEEEEYLTSPMEDEVKIPSSRKSSATEDDILFQLPDNFDFDGKVKKWNGIRYRVFNPSEVTNAVEDMKGKSLKSMLENPIEKEDLPRDLRSCQLCHDVADGETDGPGRLLNTDFDSWVHLNCALWSTDVYETCNGALVNVESALKRAESVICVKCHKNGASLKCFKHRCNNVYHVSCALSDKCMFLKDKSFFCPIHSNKGLAPDTIMSCLSVFRRVYVNRDEQKQLANVISDQGIMRVGSLIFLNIGQLLPQQLASFHTPTSIYPVGYKVARFYWDRQDFSKRSKYICTISDRNGHPEFAVYLEDPNCGSHEDHLISKGNSPRIVWQEVVGPIAEKRKKSGCIKVFTDYITGEDLFGLTELAVVRILESLPGIDTLSDYNFKFGRSQFYELPLAINPSGCARTEPKMRSHFKRPHTLHTSNPSRSTLQSSFTGFEVQSPYIKQFVHSKSSQYRKMKTEWKNNVYLARSRIAGLGLYASRDIEKHTMVIEYIGQLIRNEIAERNERLYEQQNRGGVYMFRLNEQTVVDATLTGGLARYVNHSCNPNCVAEVVQIDREDRILIIASRRISKGEELTYDYRFEVEDDSHKIPCLCGAVGCRKWMN